MNAGNGGGQIINNVFDVNNFETVSDFNYESIERFNFSHNALRMKVYIFNFLKLSN